MSQQKANLGIRDIPKPFTWLSLSLAALVCHVWCNHSCTKDH